MKVGDLVPDKRLTFTSKWSIIVLWSEAVLRRVLLRRYTTRFKE